MFSERRALAIEPGLDLISVVGSPTSDVPSSRLAEALYIGNVELWGYDFFWCFKFFFLTILILENIHALSFRG